jgi:hypothetical protein
VPLVVPLLPVASQTFNATINDQATNINVYSRLGVLYMDVYLNAVLVIGGVACWNANVVIRNSYLGYSGDFAFYDTEGLEDPVYTGLGTRFILVYLFPSELVPPLA